MKLSFLIKEECIIQNLKFDSTTKEGIIKTIVDKLFECTDLKDKGVTHDEILKAFLDREQIQSTGIGDEVGLPHIRLNNVQKFYSLLIILDEGVNFDSVDKKPVRYFFVNIVNRANPNILLKSRALILRFLADAKNKEQLSKCANSAEIWKLLNDSTITTEFDILASDIMKLPPHKLTPDMTLRDTAAFLHKYHTDALPVVDNENVFLGDISCHDLFSFGLPDFFFSLNQVSFVKHMNPFEKYFLIDRTMKVGDLITKKESSPTVNEKTTIMEIIFEMAVNNREILYVLDDKGKLSGILDRHTIIDKIYLANI